MLELFQDTPLLDSFILYVIIQLFIIFLYDTLAIINILNGVETLDSIWDYLINHPGSVFGALIAYQMISLFFYIQKLNNIIVIK